MNPLMKIPTASSGVSILQGNISPVASHGEFNPRTRFKIIATASLWASFLLTGTATANDAEIVKQLKACAGTPEQSARIACYEALGAQVLHDTSEVTTTEVAEKTAEPAQTLPDSIGGGDFAEAAGEEKPNYRGHVTSCKKSADRRWFFIFDNGQVWKQVDRRKRRYKDCDFYVTLTEDAFGYLMQIDGEDSTVRVDRRR